MHLNEGFVEGLGTEKIEREEITAASGSQTHHLLKKIQGECLTADSQLLLNSGECEHTSENVIFGDFQLRSSLHESPMTSSEDTKLALYSVSYRQHSFSHQVALVILHCQSSSIAAALF